MKYILLVLCLLPLLVCSQMTPEEKRAKRAEIIAKKLGFDDADYLMHVVDSTRNYTHYRHKGHLMRMNIILYSNKTFAYDIKSYHARFEYSAGKWFYTDSTIILASDSIPRDDLHEEYPQEKFEYIQFRKEYLFIRNKISLKSIKEDSEADTWDIKKN